MILGSPSSSWSAGTNKVTISCPSNSSQLIGCWPASSAKELDSVTWSLLSPFLTRTPHPACLRLLSIFQTPPLLPVSECWEGVRWVLNDLQKLKAVWTLISLFCSPRRGLHSGHTAFSQFHSTARNAPTSSLCPGFSRFSPHVCVVYSFRTCSRCHLSWPYYLKTLASSLHKIFLKIFLSSSGLSSRQQNCCSQHVMSWETFLSMRNLILLGIFYSTFLLEVHFYTLFVLYLIVFKNICWK